MLRLLLALASFMCATSQPIELITFDGAAATTHTFTELNDPVMGGQSTGSWSLNSTGDYGVFQGDVVDVPSLKAPGFIKASADGKYPDVSSAFGGALVLVVRSSTPDYTGFRFSFASGTVAPSYSCAGGGSIPFSRGCFKSHFTVPETAGKWAKVRIPFSNFTDLWSPATGEPTKLCAQDSSACANAKVLASIKRVEVWAEGVGGQIHLEIAKVYAEPAGVGQQAPTSRQPPAEYDLCRKPVQHPLRYGISGRTDSAGVPVEVSKGEDLASAVCCDKRALPFAEPRFLYQAPDIHLYNKLSPGVTTFYDSACGLPLFRTPVGRSLDDFKADTDEHGWPSFRSGEVFTDNVHVDNSTGYVFSQCGTHLGSFDSDAKGPRWCIDLSCIAGIPSGESY